MTAENVCRASGSLERLARQILSAPSTRTSREPTPIQFRSFGLKFLPQRASSDELISNKIIILFSASTPFPFSLSQKLFHALASQRTPIAYCSSVGTGIPFLGSLMDFVLGFVISPEKCNTRRIFIPRETCCIECSSPVF